MALALAALAVAGATVLHWPASSNFYHAVVALLFACAGFFVPDHVVVRQLVMGLGVLVLGVKVLMVAALWLSLGRFEHGPMAVTCFVVGTTSILAAAYQPTGRDRSGKPS